jgi:hypothetical protein
MDEYRVYNKKNDYGQFVFDSIDSAIDYCKAYSGSTDDLTIQHFVDGVHKDIDIVFMEIAE